MSHIQLIDSKKIFNSEMTCINGEEIIENNLFSAYVFISKNNIEILREYASKHGVFNFFK